MDAGAMTEEADKPLAAPTHNTVLAPDELAWAQQIAPSPREEKEIFIYELMVRMRWFGPESVRSLAQVWNIGAQTVHAYSKKAREKFRAHFENPEDVRARWLQNMEFIAADALRKKKAMKDGEGAIKLVPDPDHGSAIRALNSAAAFAGLKELKPAEEQAKEYEDKEVGEILALARKRGILAPASEPSTDEEIVTQGEDADGSEGILHTPPSEAGRGHGAQRVRGRHARRNQDPVGGRDSFGREIEGQERPAHPDRLRIHGRDVDGTTKAGKAPKGGAG